MSVLKTPHIDDVRTVTTVVHGRAPSPRVKIYECDFPSSANVGEKKNYHVKIRNVGNAGGRCFIWLYNLPKNPGKIITDSGSCPPGARVSLFEAWLSPGEWGDCPGWIMFEKPGTYVYEIQAGHWESSGYVIDHRLRVLVKTLGTLAGTFIHGLVLGVGLAVGSGIAYAILKTMHRRY